MGGGTAGEVESGAIDSLLGSVRGVRKVSGAGPTSGGADQDDERRLRFLVPTRARAFGRAVSLDDLVDLSLGYPGVTHASGWQGSGPPGCPCGASGLHVAFVRQGTTGPRPPDGAEIASLAAYLDARRDVTVPLCVCAASVTHPPVQLSVELAVDPRRQLADVIAAVVETLVDADGALAPSAGPWVSRSTARTSSPCTPGGRCRRRARARRARRVGAAAAPDRIEMGADRDGEKSARHRGARVSVLTPSADWLPLAVRDVPAEHPDAPRLLDALLAAVDRQRELLSADVEQVWEDFFVESCADWAVPYIGELLGLPPEAERREVATAIALRRRKGTPTALEDFAEVVTGFTALVREGWQTTLWAPAAPPSTSTAGGLRRPA